MDGLKLMSYSGNCYRGDLGSDYFVTVESPEDESVIAGITTEVGTINTWVAKDAATAGGVASIDTSWQAITNNEMAMRFTFRGAGTGAHFAGWELRWRYGLEASS